MSRVARAIDRRQFLGAAAGVLASSGLARASEDWNAGEVVHLLPAANHETILLKASFSRPIGRATLRVDGTVHDGTRTDSGGQYWRFLVRGLEPGKSHTLRLYEGANALCDEWQLCTLPDPDSRPERLRLLLYTCVGGLEGMSQPGTGKEYFRPLSLRRRLLARGLSFSPDAVIAIGDHVYWDQRGGVFRDDPDLEPGRRSLFDRLGYFDYDAPMIGTANEETLKRVVEPQISQLYGTALRSVPTWFLCDDHDYYENDDADPSRVTFPPVPFGVRAQQATARLFYPQFLPDSNRPSTLSGAGPSDLPPGTSETFGTVRWGRLFEALLWDCGRFMSLKGPSAGLVPDEVERWLLQRTASSEVAQLASIPSHPMGWTAGKWREWYPDVLADPAAAEGEQVVRLHSGMKGVLTTRVRKYMWQEGWWSQHQRLLEALASQPGRPALMLSGDLHASGWARILKSGDLDLRSNPVHSILTGPLGSSAAVWPSAARGVMPSKPEWLELDERQAPLEHNGFTILDVEPSRMTARLFTWHEPQTEEEIDTLEPRSVAVIEG